MGRGGKRVVFFLWGAGVFLALLAALALLAPWLVNTQSFKRRAVAELEQRTGARISYHQAEVSLFPRIRIAARGVTFDLADRAHGNAALFRADAALLPLLTGKFRIGNVTIDAPVFRARLPARGERGKPFSPEEAEGRLASLLASLQEKVPGATVEIRNGTLELADAAGPVLSLRGLQARVSLPPARIAVRLRCASEYWDDLSAEASLLPERLHGEARFETAGLRLDRLAGRLAPGAVPWLGETDLSLRGRLESEGFREVTADFSGSLPALTIRRHGRSRTVRVRSVDGSFALGGNGARATLKELLFDEPKVRLSGELAVDRATPRIEATVTGRDLGIAPVRATVLAVAGDVPQVREVLEIVRDGTVPRFAVRLGGRSWADLANVDALEFNARVTGGTIFIPGVDFTLSRVSGDASMSRGVLSGRDISAGLGGARCDHGSFRMGITEDDPSLFLDLQVDTPAGEVLPRLRAIVSPEQGAGVLDRIRDLRGNASGRLVLKGRLSSLLATVTVSSMRMTGTVPGVPFPIGIDGGQARFSSEEEQFSVSEVRGTLGGSSFSGVSGRVAFSGGPVLSVRSGHGQLNLGELFPWAARLEAVRDSIEAVHSVQGTLVIEAMAIDGPAHAPGEWKFDVSGDFRGVELETSRAPGPVSIANGRFRLRPRDASLLGVEASVLDATFRGSAEARWTGEGIQEVTSSFDAHVGPEAARWGAIRFQVPGAINVRAPFSVRKASFAWEKGWKVSWKGDLDLPEGPAVSISGVAAPGETRMDHVIRDDASDARLSIASDNGALRTVRYKGILTAATAEKLVRLSGAGPFVIRGDMALDLDRARPERSSARGTLEVQDLAVPWVPDRPLRIQALSLSGEGRELRVNSARLTWDNVPFAATGTAAFDGGGVTVDADVAAGGLRLEPFLATVVPRGPEAESAVFYAPIRFPVHGTVRFGAESVTYGTFTWRPVRAEARLEDGILRVAVTDATLCGASTLGSITFGVGAPSVALSMSASGQGVDQASVCLLEQHVAVTGTYDASARLEGKGTGDALLHSLQGPLSVTLKDGRILKLTVLSKIFGLLNVTNLLRGKLPDVEKEGFPYRSLVLQGDIKDGKLFLEEAAVDAPSMGIAATGEVDLLGKHTDIEVLVAPFTTANAIIRWIPGVSYILGGTLVSIPVTVKGDILDPKVTPMSPAAVGEGLLGVMTRTLKLPVKAIDLFEQGETRTEAP